MRKTIGLRSLVIAGLLWGGSVGILPLQANQPTLVAQSIWKPFMSPEGGFTVLFPGTPTQSSRTQKTAIGSLPMTSFSVERPNEAAYLVIYADFPAENLGQNPQQLFDSGRDEAVRRVQGRLLSEQNISLNGMPGRQLRIEHANGLMIHNRIYLSNQRMYQVIAVTPKNKERHLTKSISGFLDSFKLLPR